MHQARGTRRCPRPHCERPGKMAKKRSQKAVPRMSAMEGNGQEAIGNWSYKVWTASIVIPHTDIASQPACCARAVYPVQPPRPDSVIDCRSVFVPFVSTLLARVRGCSAPCVHRVGFRAARVARAWSDEQRAASSRVRLSRPGPQCPRPGAPQSHVSGCSCWTGRNATRRARVVTRRSRPPRPPGF